MEATSPQRLATIDEDILKEKYKRVGPNYHYTSPRREMEAETIPTYMPRVSNFAEQLQ
jgi:hypothetical protein